MGKWGRGVKSVGGGGGREREEKRRSRNKTYDGNNKQEA